MPLSRADEPRPSTDEVLLRHRDRIRRYLRYLGATADAVDDLTQDTFAKACEAPFEWRSDAATGAWLRAVARTAFLGALRRRGLPVAGDRVDELAAVWERHCGDDDGEALATALRACLQELRERHRQALAWRYAEDCSVSVVGERLGIGAAGADSLLARIRAALRRCIERREPRS